MRIAIVITMAISLAGGLGFWLGTAGDSDLAAQMSNTVEALILEDEADAARTVCSMDPRYRPRPGARSCRSGP